MVLLLFIHKLGTEAAKELRCAVISFGHAFTTNAFVANSNEMWHVK